jgi:hypothetical protein
MAFERFFNLGESGAEDLGEDLSKCLVLEKLDGTLISLWWDRTANKWQCSTRGMLYADGTVGQLSTKTFSQLFWEAWANNPDKTDINQLNKSFVYVFELTSLENRIVTPYEKTGIHLLTIRDLTTLHELSRAGALAEARRLLLPIVYSVHALDWESLRQMQGKEVTYEGYVVVKESIGSHRRVKVKNPAYLAISRLFGKGTTEKALMEMIKCGDWPEFLTYYPQYESNFKHLQGVFQKLCDIVRRDYGDLVNITERKDFAQAATQKMFPSLLFAMRDGKITTLEKDLLLYPVEKLLILMHKAETET